MRDQAGPSGLLIDQPSQGRGYSEVVDHRGPQVEREGANLLDCLPDDAETVLDAGPRFGGARALDDLEIDPDHGEGLTDLVVGDQYEVGQGTSQQTLGHFIFLTYAAGQNAGAPGDTPEALITHALKAARR